MSNAHDETIDALRLNEQQKQAIMNRMKRRVNANNRHDSRANARKPFYRDNAVVEMHHPGGSRIRYRVQTVNLSTYGVGFLHGSFCYTGTPTHMVLATCDNQPVRLTGKIVRCQLVEGRVHEVGMAFKAPIQLSDFVEDCDPNPVEPQPNALAKLRGRVLYIEDALDNRELMGFMTDQMGLELSAVESAEQAKGLIEKQSFDLVVADLWLPDHPEDQIIAAVREAGYEGPIIGATARTDTPPEELAEKIQCSAVLAMPFTAESLTETFQQFLMRDRLADGKGEALLSEQWANVQMRPVIVDFLSRLEKQLSSLQSLLKQGEGETLRRHIYKLKSAAGGYGYSQISEAAGRFMELIDEEAEHNRLQQQLNSLIDLCSSACLGSHQTDS